MRILHVITGLGTGGAEMMLLKLLSASKDFCGAQSVVSMIDLGTVGVRLQERGFSVNVLGMRRGAIGAAGLWRFLCCLRRFDPTLVVSWMYHANTLALFAALRGRVPIIWNIRHSLHDIKHERPLTRAVIRAGALTSAIPAKIVYNSARSLEQHAAIGYRCDGAVVIPNGFDSDHFKPSDEHRDRWSHQLGLDRSRPVIGLIARYHPMKDHALFVRAAARVAQEFPSLVVVMAGTGVDERNGVLWDTIRAHGLSSRVRLLGELADPAPVLNMLDVVCLTSSWGEGFPNVLGEAMLCGKPCVTTDVGDAPVVVGESGAVVPVGQADLFAERVCELLRLSQTSRAELGDRARARMIRSYGIEAVARKYSDLYESVPTNARRH
jgi:glycosyltransferase involved in cell wall biosynthesis